MLGFLQLEAVSPEFGFGYCLRFHRRLRRLTCSTFHLELKCLGRIFPATAKCYAMFGSLLFAEINLRVPLTLSFRPSQKNRMSKIYFFRAGLMHFCQVCRKSKRSCSCYGKWDAGGIWETNSSLQKR